MRREEKSNQPSVQSVDLRGVPCPLSWARTKVRLESLAEGEALVVWTDDPRGARDMPRAAEAEGYAVDSREVRPGLWTLTIQR